LYTSFGILRAFPSINIAKYKSLNIHVKSICVTVRFGRIAKVTNIYANYAMNMLHYANLSVRPILYKFTSF